MTIRTSLLLIATTAVLLPSCGTSVPSTTSNLSARDSRQLTAGRSGDSPAGDAASVPIDEARTVLAKSPSSDPDDAQRSAVLELRIGSETLRNPYWYADNGRQQESSQFWDTTAWDSAFHRWAEEGYNAILYWIEPWNKHAWQTFLIRHSEFPEARDLTLEQYDRVIEHVNWIFRRAREHGLKNILFTYSIVTTPAFAKAHGLERLPVSAAVDFRHTLADMGPHFGVRSELTRAFTEKAVVELFQTYPELDGLSGAMGEAVPGKRSTWYKEAIVPGLKRSGREPIFLAASWMQPFEDFIQDMAPREVYTNTWLSLHANAEMFTDAKPYPTYVRWLEMAGVPTVVEVMHHNVDHGFPFNSPRLAWEIVHECRKFESCKGILAWFSIDHHDYLMRKALAHYAANPGPYADEVWVQMLEERFGNREAAEHFLRAYNSSARIIPELSAIAWVPHDLSTSRTLLLPYWYWTDEDPRWSTFVSPSRGGILLPLRYYAKVVARLGPQFRDNSGADYDRNREHPGSQELIWGLGDYPTTPEAHIRKIRQLGAECQSEAEAALKTVQANRDEAQRVYHYMMAYKLLTDYYERKVLAATAALIYGFGGGSSYRTEAEQLADEAVERYRVAINFIQDTIDKNTGTMRGRWLDGKNYTLPELIGREQQERKQLSRLFQWPDTEADTGKSRHDSTGPKAGTFAPEK
jgi:hypothetical protein